MNAIQKVSDFFKDVFLLGESETQALINYPSGSNYPYGLAGASGGSKWPLGLSASGSSLVIDHQLMRQNARSAYHDNVQAKALVDRMADTVVDTGLVLDPDPMIEILGIDSERAREWSENVATRFHLWAKSKKVTRDEVLNFYQIQRLIEITQQRDNDYFIRFFYSNKKDLINPLQIQMIDANQINGAAFTDTNGFQQNFVDGIKRDEAGKEIAYKVFIQKEDGSYTEKMISAYGSKSKQRLMLHGFNPEYPNQGRGYSRIGHALQEFENLTDFTSAQIKKAILQSSINMYVKPSADSPASNPLEGISQHVGAGPLPSIIAADPEANLENQIGYIPIPEATITNPGSVGVFNLQGGEDLKAFSSTAPSDSFSEFVMAFTSYLAASVSMPVEVMLMKFNQNYSASRASLILFWRVAQIWRAELEVDSLNPIYESWIVGEIAAGRIIAPGWNDPLLRAAWLNNKWFGAPMPNIDPMRTMEADKGYVEMGAVDLDQLARNYNGSSGKLNRTKLAKQVKELTLVPWSDKTNPNTVEND